MIGEQDLPAAEEALRARNNRFGMQLLLGADASFFLAFFFAYLYLKTIDTPDLWAGTGSGGSALLGGVWTAALVVAAVVTGLGARGIREGMPSRWRLGAWAGVAMGLLALVVMAWQLATIGYNPSGHDSVLIGWTAALGLHVLLVTPLLLGSALQPRQVAAGALDLAGISALSWFYAFLAAVGLLEFVLLFLVR